MKHKISETGSRMLKYQEQLADEYKYKPIPRTFFKDVRAEFEEALPEWCNMSGDTTKLETRSGTVIASGYNRIVIGDYGAFVEFSHAQANGILMFVYNLDTIYCVFSLTGYHIYGIIQLFSGRGTAPETSRFSFPQSWSHGFI